MKENPDSKSGPGPRAGTRTGHGATAEATALYARKVTEGSRLPPGAFRPLGRTGLTTSALGFGSYRVELRDANHAAALHQALKRGINLIDTSSNYGNGGSETLIGRVLAEAEEEFVKAAADTVAPDTAAPDGESPRARTILVSKVGYVQGQNMDLVRKRAKEGTPFPEMVEYETSCWHCIHPEFIADQLERSLHRLGVSTIDVFLLHNPEYFFSDWIRRNPGEAPAPAREEFYRRIGEAFRFLETCVAEGRIQWYGVSSNTFGTSAEQPDFVSLEELIALGADAGGAGRGGWEPSGFAVVQCPLNLLEGGPLLHRNQKGGSRTFLQLAEEAGLAVLVNRPLNAIQGGRLIRFADVPVPRTRVDEEIKLSLDALLAEEQIFAGLFRPAFQEELPEDAGPYTPFEWSEPLRRSVPQLKSREQWDGVLESQIYPKLEQAAGWVKQHLTTGRQQKDFMVWFPQYCRKLEVAAGLITEGLGRKAYERALGFHNRLEPLLDPSLHGLPLSQKALLPLLALPGVTCVLNGMRRPTYVEDSTAATALPALEAAAAEAILRAFAGLEV